MARKTNIYTQLHNANIGEYVTDSIDIFDSYSNQSQYDFNKSVRSMIANSAVIGGVSNLKLKITPSSFYVKSSEGCTLTCEVTFNDEDYTDVVIKWQIERISVNKQDDEEWFEKKNNGETTLTNVIEISTADLNGDAAMFIVTAIITTDMKCDNSVSLMGYSSQGLFTFDLNNQIDFVATDNMFEVQWNQFIETRATLTYGYKKIIPDNISFEYNGLPEGCATYNNKEDFDITVTLPKGRKVNYNNALIVNVSGEYKGEKYNKQAIFTIKADTDGVTYNVAPSRDKIRLSSTGVYTPTTLKCGVRKQTINGITYPSTLPDSLRLTMTIDEGEEQDITPSTIISLFGSDMVTVTSGIIFTLYEKGQFLDQEWVPVISDGVTGESTIKLDLDNEMDAIPVDSDYQVLEDTVVSTNATMYYGYDEMAFVRNAMTKITITTPEKEEEQYLSNIKSKITYKKNNKLLYITISCKKGDRIPKRITITLTALGAVGSPGDEGYKSKLQTAVFTVMPMVVSEETPLYYLIPSANSIKVDKTNARQPINIGVTCKKRTGELGYITTDYGYVEYRIDDDKVQRYNKPLDTEDIGEQIIFEYYDDNGELLDRESIPVIFDGKDGASGRSIKDMHEYYLATATKDDIPSYDEEWLLDEFPDESLFNEEYPYLWNYEETIYINYGDDASVWRSTPSIITHYVKGIKSIDEYYLAVPENSGIDTSYVKEQDIFLTKNGLYEWQKTVIPEMSDISAYLWNFERINYDTGTFTTTAPGIIGIHGESNFFADIDNQSDFIAVDQNNIVIPSNVHYDESIILYAELDRHGEIIPGKELKPRDIIFYDNPSNEGTVVIKSNVTVYYGNTKAEIKGIGFEYSDDTYLRAEAYNLPNTIYPIIIIHDNSMNEESEPEPIGSYQNPYTVAAAKVLSNSEGKGTAKAEYVARGDIYVNGYIVGYLDETGDAKIGTPPASADPTTLKGIVLYHKIWSQGEDDVKDTLRVYYDADYTDEAIYNTAPDQADVTASEEDPTNPDLHPYGLNIKNKVQYLDKVVTIMGIMKGGKLTATDYAELYYDPNDGKIITFSNTFGAYDLSSVDFYVFVKPNVMIPKTSWVRIAMDVEAFGKVHRLYTVLSLYSAAPGQDARFYQLQPSHKQIQRRKDGTYVPSLDTNITCHIVKRIGNDFLYDVPFYDTEDEYHENDAYGDVSLFYSIDSGDYVYIPFTTDEWATIRTAIDEHPSEQAEDEPEGVTNLAKYSSIRITPTKRENVYKEILDPTIPVMPSFDRYDTTVQAYIYTQTDAGIDYGAYYVAKDQESRARRSNHFGEFPIWKLRDIFETYLNADGTFKTDENGNIIAAFSQISFLLTDAKTGEQVDIVQIPVMYDGEETIIADLTNEMDAVAMDELNYTISESILKTTFTIHVGKENKAIKEESPRPGQLGSIAPANLHLLIDEEHEIPLTKFYTKKKNNTIVECTTNILSEDNIPANIYHANGMHWEYLHIVETNEYELTIYVPQGIGDEKINGEDIWKHNRLILEVRAAADIVSGSPDNPTKTVQITRSSIFTIHGVACGEDGVIYQIQPTYNKIKVDELGVYSPDTIDCVITRRYGTADPVVYKDFSEIYRNFLMGPAERTEHAFGRDALVIGYSIDNDNNLNNNAFLPAHWWVHKGYADRYIQSDDDNDSGTYYEFPANMTSYIPEGKTYEDSINGKIERSQDVIDAVLTPVDPEAEEETDPENWANDDPRRFFRFIEYPSIPSYRIGEQITFYLYQKTLSGDYRLLDLESVPVVTGAHEINPNLVNGTEDGGVSAAEKWTSPGNGATFGLHNFRFNSGNTKMKSPYIFMQPGKEFVVSLECRLLTVDNNEDFVIDEDIEMVPPKYMQEPIDENELSQNQLITMGYHTIILEFFDEMQISETVYYQDDDPEVIEGTATAGQIKIPKNNTGVLYFKGHHNTGYTQSKVILTNWGNSDKTRFKEWTKIKFDVYQADDIIVDTEKAYFTLTYIRPGGSQYILQCRHIKLEYGDVATMWLPSVWDSKGETTERVFEYYYATKDLNENPVFYSTVESLENELVTLLGGQPYPKTWENSQSTKMIPCTGGRPARTYEWHTTTAAAGHGLDAPYLWNVEIIVNQHDLIASVSKPALITVSGQKIEKIEEYYLATNLGSGVTTSTPGWRMYNPDDPEETLDKYTFGLNDHNNYLWNYEKIYYSIGDTAVTEPIIISVFNSNLRIDMDNEVDAIPVDHETYKLSSDKNMELNTRLSFYHGTLKMTLRKIYATVDIFTQEFLDSIDIDIDGIELAELMDVFHLNVNVEFLTRLILNATDIKNSENHPVDETLTIAQQELYQKLDDGESDDSILSYIEENISKKFLIERMIMNAVQVKIDRTTSILVPTYKCKLNNRVDIEISEDNNAQFPSKNDELIGETDLNISIIANSDSIPNYQQFTTNYNGSYKVYPAHKIFPKIIDQRIPIKISVSGSHLEESTEIYYSSALFSLMIFEGDGVFQLVPSCTEIKETSTGFQYATGSTFPIFETYKPNTDQLYVDNVNENSEIENLDFITCKILYRKGAEDSSLYLNYNDVSNYLILEISDDGGAYLKPEIWGGETGVYKGTDFASIPIVEDIREDIDTHTKYLVTHPWAPDASGGLTEDECKTYNLGTGNYPRIPLFNEKVLNYLIENDLEKSNWYISNAVTFKLKLKQYNTTTHRYTEVLVDSETIPVVKDGKDGLDGAAQARNYLDGTDDGSEYTRKLTVKNITDLYYDTGKDNKFIISCPYHMYINYSINSAIKLQYGQTERDYVRLSGLLRLSEYNQNVIQGGDGYYISWGKPNIALTLAIIVTDGKGIIKEGTYHSTITLFNILANDGNTQLYPDAIEAINNTLNTTQSLKIFDNIVIQNYLAKTDGAAEDEALILPIGGDPEAGAVLGQTRFSYNGYRNFGITFRATGTLANITKNVFIDLFKKPYMVMVDDEEEVPTDNILMASYVQGGAAQENDKEIEYLIKWYATPTSIENLDIDTLYGQNDKQNGKEEYPYIKVSIENPLLPTDKVLDVSVININTMNDLITIRKQKDTVIVLDELISIPEKFHKNSYVKLETFMLPEVEIAYDSFKLETEADAPKVPTAWTASEVDKKRPTNYNILFGAETNYYENAEYWKLLAGPKNAMILSNTDEDGRGILTLRATNVELKCKNLNTITPNAENYYTFSFDAMYNGAQLKGGKIDVYFMLQYNPPFDDISSIYTATTIDGEEYTYNYDGDNLVPPTLEKNQVFDNITGTYVYAHEQFELTKDYQRYTLFTPHAREISSDILLEAPYVYNFYILIVHPGSAQGIARRSEVFIKKCKLEKGLYPTPYEINLDEYKGCAYDLIPYFETVEVRTDKQTMEFKPFDVATETFESVRSYEDEETGELITENLSTSNLYTIEEISESENILDWYTIFNEYTNIVDDSIVAYLSTGIPPTQVPDLIITHDANRENEPYKVNRTYRLTITVSENIPYVNIFYYIQKKTLYLLERPDTDYEKLVLNNGLLFTETAQKQPLMVPATVYAIGTRDLWSNSEVATYEYIPKNTIYNIYGEYTSYIDNNSLSMGWDNTKSVDLSGNTILFSTEDNNKLVGHSINTFIFTFDTTANQQITSDTNIIISKYTVTINPDNNHVDIVRKNISNTVEDIYITIYKSEASAEHIVKYTDTILLSSNEYIGFHANTRIKATVNINEYNEFYTSTRRTKGYELNFDVGYTNNSGIDNQELEPHDPGVIIGPYDQPIGN